MNRKTQLFFGPPLALLTEGLDKKAKETLADRLEVASFADLVATVEALGF